MRDAQTSLMRRVFGESAVDDDSVVHNWHPFAAFDTTGTCVAALEARRLTLCLDDEPTVLTGLRHVAVDPRWRGLGLFRDLMALALPWCEAQSPYATLLFTEEPALYERFGFRQVQQHAFEGATPNGDNSKPTQKPRRLDPRRGEDAALIARLLATRIPVSRHCALADAPDLARRNILAAQDLVVAYAADLDALVLYEADVDLLVVDVIAAAIPSMARIVTALQLQPRHITTLFPPDLLHWAGCPREDDTGLMARGILPPAMTRPFMLPPTAEF